MELEHNVNELLTKTAKQLGEIKAINYSIMVKREIEDFAIKSPIERLFFIALTSFVDYMSFNYQLTKPVEHSKDHSLVYIQPQFAIDRYKVDFLIENYGIDGTLKSVIVELDGHEFHDKDKHQRAYEKSRDRLLTRTGYKTLHFTGSEIFKEPFTAVLEALEVIGVISDGLIKYHFESDPFSVEFYK